MKTPLKKHNPTIFPPQKSKNDLPSILLVNLYYGEHVIYGPRCYTAESKIRIPFFKPGWAPSGSTCDACLNDIYDARTDW